MFHYRHFFQKLCSPALNGLGFRLGQRYLLALLDGHCSLAGKTVVELGSDADVHTAVGMLRFGAKEVLAFNPIFTSTQSSPDPRIVLHSTLLEEHSLPENSADVIFGMALLEHVANPEALAQTCRRLLKPGGFCLLQGNPLWPSAYGHHTWVEKTPSGASYYFNQKSNPFAPWEHLMLESKEDVLQMLSQKGIPLADAQKIYRKVYLSKGISRKTVGEITAPFFALENTRVMVKTLPSLHVKNKYYTKALEKYSAADLRTLDMRVYMWG